MGSAPNPPAGPFASLERAAEAATEASYPRTPAQFARIETPSLGPDDLTQDGALQFTIDRFWTLFHEPHQPVVWRLTLAHIEALHQVFVRAWVDGALPEPKRDAWNEAVRLAFAQRLGRPDGRWRARLSIQA